MGIPFRDHNHFDAYAAKSGWGYDNGWTYQDKLWDAYAGTLFGKGDHLVMLRDRHARLLVVHYIDDQATEVWSGQVDTQEDFDKVIKHIGHYTNEYVSSVREITASADATLDFRDNPMTVQYQLTEDDIVRYNLVSFQRFGELSSL